MQGCCCREERVDRRDLLPRRLRAGDQSAPSYYHGHIERQDVVSESKEEIPG